MNNTSTQKSAAIPLGSVFLGFAITVILTQASIWLPLYLLHKNEIISDHLSWPQTALISIIWTLTRLWWMNLHKEQHDDLPTRRNNSDPLARGR